MITKDGWIKVWDYFYRQNEVAYTHKVGDCALSSIANDATTGRLLSVGDVEGTVALMEVCDSLATPQHNEKSAIGAMLERETKQEKNLELRERDLRRARDKAKGETGETEEEKELKAQAMEEQLRAVDADFLNMIKEAEDDEATAAAEE